MCKGGLCEVEVVEVVRVTGVVLEKVMAEMGGSRCGVARLMAISTAVWITGVATVREYNTRGVTTAGVEGGTVHEVN